MTHETYYLLQSQMFFLTYSTAICDQCLVKITAELKRGSASYAANLIVHPTNARLAEDVDLVVKHKSPLVIASVGNPARIVDAIRGYGECGFLRRYLVKHADARQKPEWMV